MAYRTEAEMRNALIPLDEEDESPEEARARRYADAGGKPDKNGNVPAGILYGDPYGPWGVNPRFLTDLDSVSKIDVVAKKSDATEADDVPVTNINVIGSREEEVSLPSVDVQGKSLSAADIAQSRGADYPEVQSIDVVAKRSDLDNISQDEPGTVRSINVSATTPKLLQRYQDMGPAESLEEFFKDYLAMGDQISLAAKEQAKSLHADQAKMQAANVLLQQALGLEGTANAQYWTAQEAAEANRRARATKVLQDTGMDPDDKHSIVSEMTTKQRDLAVAVQAKRKELDDKEAQIPSLIANPLGYVIGHMALKPEIDAYNNLNAQYAQVTTSLSRSAKTFQEVYQSQVVKDSVGQSAGLLAKADLARAESSKMQAQAQILAAQANSHYASIDMQADLEKFKVLQGALTFLRQTEQHKQAEAHKAIAEAEHISIQKLREVQIEQAIEAQKDAAKKRALEAETEATELSIANKAADMMGRERKASVKAYNALPTKEKAERQLVMNSGGTEYGKTYQEARDVMRQGNINRMPGDTAVMMGEINRIDAETMFRLSKRPDYLAAPEAAKKLMVEKEITEAWTKLERNTQHQEGGRPNLYAMPSVKTMLDKPDIAKLQIAKVLKLSDHLDDSTPITDKWIVENVKQELKKGTLTLETATRELTYFFRTAMDHNNNSYRFFAYHLPTQEYYRFDNINWLNPAEVKTALVTSWGQDLMKALRVTGGMGIEGFGKGVTGMESMGYNTMKNILRPPTE